jgi:hypothetical protein
MPSRLIYAGYEEHASMHSRAVGDRESHGRRDRKFIVREERVSFCYEVPGFRPLVPLITAVLD